MLSSHPSIVPTKRKELCLGGLKSEIWSNYIKYLPNRTETKEKIVMSGCLHFNSNIQVMKELCMTNLKVIYILRDVADMLWSAYNFWCLKDIDYDCVPGKYTDERAIRSPEHFHLLVAESKEMGGGISLTKDGKCFQNELIEATRIYGKNNMIVLTSESMLVSEQKRESLEQIHHLLFHNQNNRFNQLNRKWLQEQSDSIYRVNSGRVANSRGEKNIAMTYKGDVEEEQNGRYQVSQFRPMLPATRQLIYIRWKEECKWLFQNYGIKYPAC